VLAATWGRAFLPFRRLTGDTNREHKKTSLRVFVEAVGIALMETQREAKRLCVFLCKVPSILKLPTFQQTTALQRKLSCRAIARKGVGGLCDGSLPAYVPFSD